MPAQALYSCMLFTYNRYPKYVVKLVPIINEVMRDMAWSNDDGSIRLILNCFVFDFLKIIIYL